MKRSQLFLLIILSFVCFAWQTQAQSLTTFVSAKTGVDSGLCTLAQPCRNLNFTLTQTLSRGVITMVDSGDYAPTTVTKAITIQAAPGVEAMIVSTSGTGILIIAGTTNFVTLRGLSLDGGGTASIGIQSSATGGVQIENCDVKNYANVGIQLTGNAGKHSISNTVVHHCGNGIVIAIATGTATTGNAIIENCRVEKNTNLGFSIASNGTGNKIKAVLFNTSAIGNGAAGFSASGNNGGSSEVMLEKCLAANNGTGISSFSSTMRVSNSIITGNTQGIFGTSILSRVNNTADHNDTQGNFTGTYAAK